MKIPTLITAGDSAGWTDNAFADPSGTLITSSGGWALAYSFRGPQASGGLDLAGTAQGTGWALALTPAQTAALNTGAAALVWSWHAYATKAGSRITAGYGTVKCSPTSPRSPWPPPTTAAPRPRKTSRPSAPRCPPASAAAPFEYTIGSRSSRRAARRPGADGAALRASSPAKKRSQAGANGLGNPKRLSVRFA
jgi:hypothetical protein